MIRINLINDSALPVDASEEEIGQLLRSALEQLGQKRSIIIEVWLVDDARMTELNQAYRRLNKTTDVLSFPQAQFSQAKENLLGTIVVSPAEVKRKNEMMSDVLKHGLLHLLGFDHEIDEAKWLEAADKIGVEYWI